MTRTPLRTAATCLAVFILASGCDETPSDADAGVDAAVPIDATTPPDATAAPDAGADAGGCLQVSAEGWELDYADDVSINYRASFDPAFQTPPWSLYVQFNRYATEYVGTFPLGEGSEADYGSCARCVIAFQGAGFSERAFFARAGELAVREDPFRQRLDLTLTGVRLEEVMLVGPTLEAQPIPGGRCLELVDTTVVGTFPTAGWTCDDEDFWDGEACHCACGAYDPDCGSQCALGDLECEETPLPIEGCAAGDLCTTEGECSETCDHAGRVPCDGGGVCGFSHEGDRCFIAGEDRIDPAAVGETCAIGEFAYHCAVDDAGFAMGLCDPDEGWRCLPVCDGDDDCTVEGESCWTYFVDPTTGSGQGVCRPTPAACFEAGTECTEHLDCCTVLCEGLGEGGATTGTCA